MWIETSDISDAIRRFYTNASAPFGTEATSNCVVEFLTYFSGRGAVFRKEYSLTDCVSIAFMKAQGMTDSATGDRHFEQEGLRALFRA